MTTSKCQINNRTTPKPTQLFQSTHGHEWRVLEYGHPLGTHDDLSINKTYPFRRQNMD
jgi:hypothetical protein